MAQGVIAKAINRGASILDPLASFYICDGDGASATTYYGYCNAGGGWYILKTDTVAGTYRYAAGESDYPTAWTNRASLNYYYIYEVA